MQVITIIIPLNINIVERVKSVGISIIIISFFSSFSLKLIFIFDDND